MNLKSFLSLALLFSTTSSLPAFAAAEAPPEKDKEVVSQAKVSPQRATFDERKKIFKEHINDIIRSANSNPSTVMERDFVRVSLRQQYNEVNPEDPYVKLTTSLRTDPEYQQWTTSSASDANTRAHRRFLEILEAAVRES